MRMAEDQCTSFVLLISRPIRVNRSVSVILDLAAKWVPWVLRSPFPRHPGLEATFTSRLRRLVKADLKTQAAKDKRGCAEFIGSSQQHLCWKD